MKGRIKGIAGFYYIYTPDKGVYECKAKGIFRKEKIKPLVGDIVEIDVLDEEGKTGNITEIYDSYRIDFNDYSKEYEKEIQALMHEYDFSWDEAVSAYESGLY